MHRIFDLLVSLINFSISRLNLKFLIDQKMGLRWSEHTLNVQFELSDHDLTLNKRFMGNFKRVSMLPVNFLAAHKSLSFRLPLELD